MPHFRDLVLDNVHVSFWRLEESADEMWTLLSTMTDCAPYRERFSQIGAEKRRREWLAARCLVHKHCGAAVEVRYHDSGRPYLWSEEVKDLPEISVTHSGDCVAVAFSPRNYRVGIDLEADETKAWRVRNRFLSAREQEMLPDSAAVLGAWCAKEAIYKLCDVPGLKFLGEMVCEDLKKGQLHVKLPKMGKEVLVALHRIEGLCLALAQWKTTKLI